MGAAHLSPLREGDDLSLCHPSAGHSLADSSRTRVTVRPASRRREGQRGGKDSVWPKCGVPPCYTYLILMFPLFLLAMFPT